MLPRRYLGASWPEVFAYRHDPDGRVVEVTAGPVGHDLVRAMHRAVASVAAAGSDVVMDHVLLDPAWTADLARTMADVDLTLVGVHCPPEVLRRREAARADRTLGQAEAQHPHVHAHGRYDLAVDTSVLAPEQAAALVLDGLARLGSPRALSEWGRSAAADGPAAVDETVPARRGRVGGGA